MKSEANHHDAEIVLKLYELRREQVMRQSRDAINGKFWPKSFDELLAVTDMQHPMNAAWRQVSTYWDMVYSLARYGTVHADLLAETNGEGIFFYAKVAPYLEMFRKEVSPTAFTNCEWIVSNSVVAKQRFELMQKRVKTALANMAK